MSNIKEYGNTVGLLKTTVRTLVKYFNKEGFHVNVWHSETNPRMFIRVRCKEQLKGKEVLICVSNFNIQEGKGGVHYKQ